MWLIVMRMIGMVVVVVGHYSGDCCYLYLWNGDNVVGVVVVGLPNH